jgi:hypothetical protein
MNAKPISPLRQRMIEDMTVRNFVEKTRNDYVHHVRAFTAFLKRSPDTATPEDLRRFEPYCKAKADLLCWRAGVHQCIGVDEREILSLPGREKRLRITCRAIHRCPL